MSVAFLTADLIFASRVQAAARAAGLEVLLVGSAAALLQQAASLAAQLVILDLRAPGCDPQQIVPRLRAAENEVTILAYAPHVQHARLAVAREAGCDRVLTRGQFDQQLEAILRQFARPPEADPS